MPNFSNRRFAQAPPPDSKNTDSYFEKLIRYIPADILAAYVAISGITESNNPPLWLSWGVFGVLLVLTPLYVCLVKTDPPGIAWSKTFHWVTSCLAFSAWVFAIGGPMLTSTFAWYQPYLGSVVLILTTLIIPVMEGQFYKTPTFPPAAPPSLPPAAVAPTEPPNSQP